MTKRVRRPLEKATNLQGIPSAFRPEPLSTDEMQFYSDALNQRRGGQLQRTLSTDLLTRAGQGFFFKGVIFGNRGTGKSTELNRLFTNPDIKSRFLAITIDAVSQLNPQTFSVADVLALLAIGVIEGCEQACQAEDKAFHAAAKMIDDMQQHLAPFFPGLQNKIQTTQAQGGSIQATVFGFITGSLKIEGQTKLDHATQQESLNDLRDMLGRLIAIAQDHLPNKEIIVVGENFDREQIPITLLEETFVRYSAIIRELPLHLLFTLPVPFVYAHNDQLPFQLENGYPLYDIPVFDKDHQVDAAGHSALETLIDLRADRHALFAP